MCTLPGRSPTEKRAIAATHILAVSPPLRRRRAPTSKKISWPALQASRAPPPDLRPTSPHSYGSPSHYAQRVLAGPQTPPSRRVSPFFAVSLHSHRVHGRWVASPIRSEMARISRQPLPTSSRHRCTRTDATIDEGAHLTSLNNLLHIKIIQGYIETLVIID